MSPFKTYAEMIKAKRALAAQIDEEGEALLKTTFKAFFAAHPEIHAIQWTQYTPSFNDGEPCCFGVGSPSVKMTAKLTEQEKREAEEALAATAQALEAPPPSDEAEEEDEDEGALESEEELQAQKDAADNYDEDDDEETSVWDEDVTWQTSHPAYKAMKSFWKKMDADVLESAFGDGFKVTATRAGFETEEYNDY